MRNKGIIDLNNLPVPDYEYTLTADEIMETIWDGLEGFVEDLRTGDVANISIDINPGSVLIGMKKKNLADADKNLGMRIEDWE